VRKSFAIEKTIVSARLYATALGLYEFRSTESASEMTCSRWLDGLQHARAISLHDVTGLLHSGDNVAAPILGDGWYCGHIEFRGRQRYGDRPQLRAQIVVTFDDGSTQIIATDESWKTAVGPILESDFLMGEHYDARREMPVWDAKGFDIRAGWVSKPSSIPTSPSARRSAPRCVLRKNWPPSKSRRSQVAGERIRLRLGQNMVGARAPETARQSGQTIRLRHAEVLKPDGAIYVENLRTARQTDYYTFKSDEVEEWEPRFTFHGFRYVEIIGLTEAPPLDAVVGVVLNSDIHKTGEWSSDSTLLNQLQSNIWWGQKGNFLEVPTDCPQRDERLGWTGDAQVFARTAAFNADVAGFFAKWQRDIRDAQGANGSVPPVIPNTGALEGSPDGGPAWSDATVICPWTNYLVYGDAQVLADNYESFTRYIQHLDDISRPFGLIRSHPDSKVFDGFGDWLSTDTQNSFGTTRKDLIGTAFLSYSSKLLSKIARVLGKDKTPRNTSSFPKRSKRPSTRAS
jgi:alpha-L-rhamnosidase